MHLCAKVETGLLPGTEWKVDLLAMQWVRCNGFHSGGDFGIRIDSMGGAFKFLGEHVLECAHYVPLRGGATTAGSCVSQPALTGNGSEDAALHHGREPDLRHGVSPDEAVGAARHCAADVHDSDGCCGVVELTKTRMRS